MYDVVRIQKMIADIERYLKEFKEFNLTSVSQLNEIRDFLSSSMIVFSVVNRAIDLSGEIVASEKLGSPATYREVFYLLKKAKIIDKKMLEDFSFLVRIRNSIAHEYHTFDEEDLWKALGKFPTVKKFVKIIKNRVAKKVS